MSKFPKENDPFVTPFRSFGRGLKSQLACRKRNLQRQLQISRAVEEPAQGPVLTVYFSPKELILREGK